jgi:hypothetical protein
MSDAPSKAGMLVLLSTEVAGALDLGLGCWFAKLRTKSALGVLAGPVAGVNFGLDHKPAAAETGTPGLRLLCVYSLFEPELMVRRVPPSELFQFLKGSPIENGDSVGLLAPGDPPKRRRASVDGLGATTGELVCDCGDRNFDGSTPGLRWSTEAMSFMSYVSDIPGSATDSRRSWIVDSEGSRGWSLRTTMESEASPMSVRTGWLAMAPSKALQPAPCVKSISTSSSSSLASVPSPKDGKGSVGRFATGSGVNLRGSLNMNPAI